MKKDNKINQNDKDKANDKTVLENDTDEFENLIENGNQSKTQVNKIGKEKVEIVTFIRDKLCLIKQKPKEAGLLVLDIATKLISSKLHALVQIYSIIKHFIKEFASNNNLQCKVGAFTAQLLDLLYESLHLVAHKRRKLRGNGFK